MIIHIVTSGDTVYSLSKQYSVPESRIITDNFLDTTKKLTVGQTLIISHPCKTCSVRGGDTLASIAERNNISVMSLLQNNPQILSGNITPSQTLNIKYDRENEKSIIVAAYTGNASSSEVEKKLPYISMLHIQNAAFIDGSEIKIQKNAEPLISLAKQYRAMPIISFNCADEYGRRKADCLNSVLESPTATEAFIQSALNAVKNSGAHGIEMQLCCNDAPSRYKLYDLVLALGGILKENGYVLIIPFIPDITSDESAAQFNDTSDIIPLWSYIWDDEHTGYPAAPIGKVREALSLPALKPHLSKVLLGIATFGTEYSGTAAGYRKNTVDAEEGLRIAQNHLVSPEFSEEYGVPFVIRSGRTRQGDLQKTVYYEDARSYSDKLDLVEKFDLPGVNIMSLDYSAPVLWQLLNQRFNIIKY